MKLLSSPENAPNCQAHRLPADPLILRALRRRGFEAEAFEEEPENEFEPRVETALMALFRDFRGEQEFDALHAYTSPGVLMMISRGLHGQGGRFDPQELCQDVFVNVYRYAGSFRDEHPRSFRGWVGAIARNVIRRRLKSGYVSSIHDLPPGVAEPADPRFGPAACASIQEERESIAGAWSILLHYYLSAWEELSPRDREALQLVEVEGFSYSEACDRLKVGMSNMKMIMFRARKRIRARISMAMDCKPSRLDLSGRQVG